MLPTAIAQRFFNGLDSIVQQALAEDIGSGDISAALVPAQQQAQARVLCRETAVICGQPWVNEVFRQLDPAITVEWFYADGARIDPGATVFIARGNARSLLTAERTALNFLQTLSSVATTARHYADMVAHTSVKILDTRKTIPGLRLAQKYAVLCGGCHNHRLGLYDAYLIKENHISACGSISNAVAQAKALQPSRSVEVEVENLLQLEEALAAKADIVLLDNFNLEQIGQAVALNNAAKAAAGSSARLEASGGYDSTALTAVAETGIDYISTGALTKHIRAIDFSMRFTQG